MMYFYLKWKNKRPEDIYISKEKPENCNFIDEFKIKKEKLFICGDICENFQDYVFPKDNKYTKNIYLSSHIQKSVRKMETEKSVKSALHLINLDYNTFIRRLPIIMLEDVTIHESLPVLVWLMIANTKGFKLKREIVKWLLGVVYHLSTCDEFVNYEHYKGDIPIGYDNDIILNTLQFRKAYGGMKGDMMMIEYYKQKIITKDILVNKGKVNIIKLDVGDLEYKDWIKSANDFHCNRYMIQYVKRSCDFTEDRLKSLIWIFSSSFNKRHPKKVHDSEEINDWNKIKDIVYKFQKNCKYY